MAETKNRQIVVRELPKGELTEDHFGLQTVEVAAPGSGQILVRTILVSLDAANRAWMQGATYRSAIEAGQVMDGLSIGEVVATGSDRFAVGDIRSVTSSPCSASRGRPRITA